ncbi:hypothetical protein B9Z65_5535 [Elsinoe australis]|uniref:Uncharacterized protein n=1 Tax=Elsinoe australis TaxID=40998 RepID=A0A2P7ZEB1_9PEZI|nr:hypothetical protein B9Z65_5535 [Elsinoe australis]
MSSGASGSDEKISAAKIQPLDSETKYNQARDQSSRGSAGSDRNLDQTRTEPLGVQGVGQHTSSHANDQGGIGRDETLQGAKIDPLGAKGGDISTRKAPGLDHEEVDSSRIHPLGGVREDMPPSAPKY